MAGAPTEEHLVHHVYAALQAASCPLVDGLYLQDVDSMLQLLCSPSQHRTDILAWTCSSIHPPFASSRAMSVRSTEPDVFTKEMAVLGQELMLCKADDLDLITGDASPQRQLRFLQQLLTLVPGGRTSAGFGADGELLLNELFSADGLPHLTHMLKPSLDPWPAHIRALSKTSKTSWKPSRKEAADVAALLKLTQSELEQLQSQCDFLNDEAQSPAFSPSSLRVAACDLQQLMSAFSHVYESDLRAYCSREPAGFSTETDVFQKVHRLLLACNTELEMLKEVSEASASVNEEVKQLQTKPLFWSRGEKRTLPDQLEEVSRRIGDFLSQVHP